jgi:hypothetical protein
LAWDLKGRKGIIPDAGGQIIPHEFDNKPENQMVYEKNGVWKGFTPPPLPKD